jgi:hypothetical protein
MDTKFIEQDEDRSQRPVGPFLPPPMLPPCPHCESRFCGVICRMYGKPRHEWMKK